MDLFLAIATTAHLGLAGEYHGFFAELGGVSGYKYAEVIPYFRAGYEITDSLSVFAAPAFETKRDGSLTTGVIIGVEFSFQAF